MVDREDLTKKTRLLDLAILGLRFLAAESTVPPEHFDPVSELASEIHGAAEQLAAEGGA